MKELRKYTMPATIALRWCLTSCNGDVQLLKDLMRMMRKHFQGHHKDCVHPFTDKCSQTKINSDIAKEQFKVSEVIKCCTDEMIDIVESVLSNC